MTSRRNRFDLQAFSEAVDARRLSDGLSWSELAKVIWDQSRALNTQREDHPISPATIRKLVVGGGVSCQHALFLLRWLDVPPEKYIPHPHPHSVDIPLPIAGESQRLRWNLLKLYEALNAARIGGGETWKQVADRLDCTPSQLTGLRVVKFAIDMRLAMRITQALHRPAADFVFAADW